jgi:protein SCO1
VARTPVTLVFFGYTHCPDICNVVLANFASALRGASPAVRKDVRLLFVSTDPARDTPDVVRDYLDRFDPTYEGLVAPVGTVEKAAKALYISYEKPDGSQGGNYMVSHGTYTTGFLHGSARVVWSADTTVADLRADLTRLARLA